MQFFFIVEITPRKTKRKKVIALNVLIISEAVECMMAISYIMALCMAYFGPNADLMIHIKSNMWQSSPITDFYDTIYWILVMLMVDFGATFISILMLGWYCKINILKMYLQIFREMGMALALSQAYYLTEVSHLCFTQKYINKSVKKSYTHTYLYI